MLSTFPTTNSNSQIPDYLALQLYSSHKATRDTKSTVVQYSPLRRGESFRRSLMLSPFLLLIGGTLRPCIALPQDNYRLDRSTSRDFELKTFLFFSMDSLSLFLLYYCTDAIVNEAAVLASTAAPGVCLSVYHSAQGCAPGFISPLPSTQDAWPIPRYLMSSATNTASASSSFETIFNVALVKYTKQTGKDLRDHPLADKIDNCDSPDSILDIFQEQARGFDEFRNGDTKLFKWLRPVVNVLHALSTNALAVLSNTGSLVSPVTFCIIHSAYLNLTPPRCFLPQWLFSPVSRSCYPCVSPSLSPPYSLSHLGLPDGQGCEGELRRSSRYFRMYRELPQTTWNLYRHSAPSCDD